jgi:hypothetical protein
MHNHIEQLALNAECFNKHEYFCNNFDVIINCNKKDIDKERVNTISKTFNSKNVVVFFDEDNEGGYNLGPQEQVLHNYDLLKQYNVVVQLHPDVFPLESFGIKKHVEECEKEKYDFMLFELPDRQGVAGWESQYATDFWIFTPTEENKNVFANFKNWLTEEKCFSCEIYMYTETKNKKIGYLDRSPCAGMKWAYEPNMGIISNPQGNEVREHLNKK